MKFLSYLNNGKPSFGLAAAGGIVDVGGRLGDQFVDLKSAIHAGALRAIAERYQADSVDMALDAVQVLPVIPNPGKIFCIGINYEAHREETGRDRLPYPTTFTRFADTLTGHEQPMILPGVSTALDYECELAVIIGKAGRHIDKAAAMEHVAGYSCFNDGSVRDWQNHTSQFTPGKNFPATGAFGPFLVTPDDVGDVHDLDIQTRLNGQVMQRANTSQLIFDIPALIEYLSTFTALSPGDVIATGTPGGVGSKREPVVFMQPGDEVIVEIEKVGVLRNTIELEQAGR